MNHVRCFLSVVGHNNFYYPADATALISNDCEYTVMPWVGGKEKNLTPIKIKKSCVVPLDIANPGTVIGSTVVWVKSNLLPLSSAG